MIITVKQGDYINTRFDELDSLNRMLNDSIVIVKDSLTKVNKRIVTANNRAEGYKAAYDEKQREYTRLEAKFRHENARHAIRYLVLSAIILFQTFAIR